MAEITLKFDELCPHGVKEEGECYECDSYRGARRERRREQIINAAVSAADKLILDHSSGETEETDYLTVAVAERFMGKVFGRLQSELMRADMGLPK